GAGAALGGAIGLSVAAPFANIWLGAFLGAVALGASAMFADVSAGAIPDQDAGERFGRSLGALGGARVVPGALLTSLIITFWWGEPHSLRAGWAMFLAGLFLGLICAAGGALVGAAGGVIAGAFAGRMGQDVLRRQGAVFGAAAAWTLAL